MSWKFFLYLLVGYLALCLLVFVFQRKLIYLPGQFRFSKAAAASEGLRHWPIIENFQGFVGNDEPENASGTVIVFHGNAGAALHRSFYVEALSRLSLRVILAEYPGYGGRPGEPSEEALVQDALQIIERAHRDYGEPIFLWGESMGSGVIASAVAKTKVPIKGLVLMTPWDSLSDLAQAHYWFLPTRWLVLDKYDSIENLRNFSGNVAVVLAREDRVVPVKHGQRLYDSITTNKKRWMFENVGHNSIPIAPQLQWWEEVIEFVARF